MHDVASENETQNIADNFTTLQSQDIGVEKKKKSRVQNFTKMSP